MPDRVVVRVPATVANLGPGFDCLGMAVAWHNEVLVERAQSPSASATGTGAESLATDESNLVMRAAAALLGRVPSVRIEQRIDIAPGRGFGSSAAAICAGLVAARALEQTGHSDEDLLALAIEMEGHADNVAPCMVGGITVTAGARTLRIEPPAGLVPLLVVAPDALPTERARQALPATVARGDAVATVARAALLAAALASGDLDAVFDATEDVFHQPARFELMPKSGMLVSALRAQRVAAFLSGAGPSVAALVPEDRVSEAESILREALGSGWAVRRSSFDQKGATVVSVNGERAPQGFLRS